MYWKLYKQFLEMLSKKEDILNQMREKLPALSGSKLEKKVNRQFFWFKAYTYSIMLVWVCLIKPFGQFYSRKIFINGSYQIPFKNISVIKSTTYKLFGCPIWHSSNQQLTQENIYELEK